MRKLKKLFLGLTLGAVMFASCKGEDPVPAGPTITATTANTTVSPGSEVVVSVIANAATGAKLKNYKVELEAAGVPIHELKPVANPNSQNFSENFTYTVQNGATGTQKLIFTVTDDANLSASATVTLTITGFSQVSDCGSKVLGNQHETTGSSFATSECAVFTIAQAKAQSGKVDFVHYYGSQNAASIAAPDNQSLEQFSTFGVTTWANRNATRFKKVTTDYANTTTANAIQAAYTTSAAEEVSLVTGLAVGDVVAFKTQSLHYGLLKVTAVSGTKDTKGSLSFDLKVQK